VAAGLRELHESQDEAHGGFDLAGLVTLTAGLFAFVLGLLRGNDWHWSSGREIGLFATAAVLLASFAAIELRQERPVFDFRLFRVPTFTGAQITAFALSSGMFAQFLFIPLYVERVLGYSAVATGVRFLPLSLLAFVVAPLAGRLSTRIPVRFLLSSGLALVGVALLLLWGVKLSSGWTTLLPGFLVAGVGIGLVNAPLASTAVSVVEPQRAGMASGINNTFRQVGIAMGIAALGALFQSTIASNPPGYHWSPRFARAIASGVVHGTQDRAAFIAGLNEIFLVAAFVLFAGAVLALLLVRTQDFVASGPAAAG
jgi:predicted MFS family arabinose efflux permease